MALTLIQQLTRPFKPAAFQDNYAQTLEKIILARSKGKKPVAVKKVPEKGKILNLMDALKASLKETEKKRAA